MKEGKVKMAKSTENAVITDISKVDPALIEAIKAQAKEEAKAEIEASIDTENATQEATLASNEAALAAAEKDMKKRIMAEPKRKIFIPENPNDPNERQAIVVNGVIFSVAKGKMVDVPGPVADVYEYSVAATKKAMAKIKVTNITNQEDVEVE